MAGNGLVYVGVPRERFYIPGFVDNRDWILGRLQDLKIFGGHFQAQGHRVDRNRDELTSRFLNFHKKPEWLLMLDSDMEHPIRCVERLLRFQQPVVGALYFHRGTHDPVAFKYFGLQPDRYGRDVPFYEPLRDEVYDFLMGHGVPMGDGSVVIDGPGVDPLLEVDAVGTGCILIHRSVLEAMEPPWFEYRKGYGSEDLQFCEHVKKTQGISIHVDMSTISGHYMFAAKGQTQFRMRFKCGYSSMANGRDSFYLRFKSYYYIEI